MVHAHSCTEPEVGDPSGQRPAESSTAPYRSYQGLSVPFHMVDKLGTAPAHIPSSGARTMKRRGPSGLLELKRSSGPGRRFLVLLACGVAAVLLVSSIASAQTAAATSAAPGSGSSSSPRAFPEVASRLTLAVSPEQEIYVYGISPATATVDAGW